MATPYIQITGANDTDMNTVGVSDRVSENIPDLKLADIEDELLFIATILKIINRYNVFSI